MIWLNKLNHLPQSSPKGHLNSLLQVVEFKKQNTAFSFTKHMYCLFFLNSTICNKLNKFIGISLVTQKECSH